MSTVVITAGRNIGGDPMNAIEWMRLRETLGRVLESVDADIYTRDALGVGEWTEETGRVIHEESVTYVGSVQEEKIAALKERIKIIAQEYAQDAIALIVGQSILVKGI